MNTTDGDDVELLAELANLYAAADPVPDGLADRILFALDLDTIDQELARLDERLVGAAGTRGAERTSAVTFSSDSLTAMITITPVDATSIRLDGWASPGDSLSVELITAQGSRHATASPEGRFEFDGLAPGWVKLIFHDVDRGDGRSVCQVVTQPVEI
jgi:hypothetical protein